MKPTVEQLKGQNIVKQQKINHIRYVAVNFKGYFLLKPKGMHTWTNDLSKARFFKTEQAVLTCINSDATKPSVKKKFNGVRKVECRLLE
jgi:hypothetical protein